MNLDLIKQREKRTQQWAFVNYWGVLDDQQCANMGSFVPTK